MIKTTPPLICIPLFSMALASCVTTVGCGRRATPPGPSSSFGMVEPNTHFQFLLWEEGLAVMLVDNITDAHHSSGHGSTRSPVHRQTGWAESKEGDRYDWEIESTDGRTAKIKIDNIDYEISKGAVFVIRVKDKRPTVDQLDLDLSELTDVADCRAFIKENRVALSEPMAEQVTPIENSAKKITDFTTSFAVENGPIDNAADLLSLKIGDNQYESLVFCTEAHETTGEPGPKGNPKTVTYTGRRFSDKEPIDVVDSITDEDVSTGFSSQFVQSTLNLLFASEIVDSNGTLPDVFILEIGGDDTLSIQAIVGGTVQNPELEGSKVVVGALDWGSMGRDLAGVTNGGFIFTKKLCGVGIDINAFNLPKGKTLKGVQINQENTEEADLVLVAGASQGGTK